jgi:hypothetical protein
MRRIRQLAIGLAALGSTALGGSLIAAAPASAGVSVGIGIGVPGPAFYGTYRIRTGPCGNPRFAYNHPFRCGYPRFSEPVFIDGIWVNEPLYYRMYGGQRYFWRGGRWVVGHGSWDGRVFRGDWRRTWHDRGWDRADFRDKMEDRRDDMRGGDRDRDDRGMNDHDRDNRGMNDHDRDNRGMNDRDDRGGAMGHDRDHDNDKDKDNNNDNDNGRGH